MPSKGNEDLKRKLVGDFNRIFTTYRRDEALKKKLVESFNKGESIFSNKLFSQRGIKALLGKKGKPKSTCLVRETSVNYGIPESNRTGALTNIEITYPGTDDLDFVTIRKNNENGTLEVDTIGTELEDGVYFLRWRPLTLFKAPYTKDETEMATGIPKVEENYLKICNGVIGISDSQLEIIDKIMIASGRVSSHAKQLVMNRQKSQQNNK